MAKGPVLLTWVSANSDPYETKYNDELKVRELVLDDDGEPVVGPNLNLLTSPDSRYCGKIRDVVLLHNAPRKTRDGSKDREQKAVEGLTGKLSELNIKVHRRPWDGDDPTDHNAVFEFVRELVPKIREQFEGRELVIHISPGSPAMHTIWVLMAETGFIEGEFKVVKTRARRHLRGREPVEDVDLGIETFYKHYKNTLPKLVATEGESVFWDPAQFKSETMAKLFQNARRLAQLNVPIMILGERGTGKTTLANWIRTNSPFRKKEQDKNWPSIASGQYDGQTMRAELFGYKKGSFTGADREHDGLLNRANKDTLFLDEIGDISSDLQRLLIRAVEEKHFVKLGSTEPEFSDFRLITATNIPIPELKKRLDPDLYDRVSLFTLRVPPLREIPEELPWLWRQVYNEAVARARATRARTRLTAVEHGKIVKALQPHPLPGNLRDLFQVAYYIIAGLNDALAPLSKEEAIQYGLQAVLSPSSDADATLAQAKAVAAAFAESAPLDHIIEAIVSENPPFDADVVLNAMRGYLGSELLRLVQAEVIKQSDIKNSERTLQDWRNKFWKQPQDPAQ